MAYNTPMGELSMPFRTYYGYHILKVNDKQTGQGSGQGCTYFYTAHLKK